MSTAGYPTYGGTNVNDLLRLADASLSREYGVRPGGVPSGSCPGAGEITLTGLRKLALQLTLGGVLAGLVATESRAQWGWTTPASPAPSAQAPASTPPPQGGSRGENFSAGKSAAQLFSSDCTGAGCHKGPQGLARDRGAGSLASFLREHYTNSRESAAALAAYLTSVPGARADPKQQPQQPRAAARTDEKPAERKPPAAIPPAAVATPSGETGEPAKPAPAAKPPRGRQAVAPAAPAVAPPPSPPAEPPAPAAPPEPPKPQWDIFD